MNEVHVTISPCYRRAGPAVTAVTGVDDGSLPG